jgi:hypothetical protein
VASRAFAEHMDAADPLRAFRSRFCVPKRSGIPAGELCTRAETVGRWLSGVGTQWWPLATLINMGSWSASICAEIRWDCSHGMRAISLRKSLTNGQICTRTRERETWDAY